MERANSAGKRIAEGRFQLTSSQLRSTENQRMLTAVYINGRQLKAAHRAQFKPDVVGAFRLGAHWPPRFASLTNVALDDVEAEGPDGPAPTALREALVQVALDDEEDEAHGRTADDAPPKKRKRESARARRVRNATRRHRAPRRPSHAAAAAARAAAAAAAAPAAAGAAAAASKSLNYDTSSPSTSSIHVTPAL